MSVDPIGVASTILTVPGLAVLPTALLRTSSLTRRNEHSLVIKLSIKHRLRRRIDEIPFLRLLPGNCLSVPTIRFCRHQAGTRLAWSSLLCRSTRRIQFPVRRVSSAQESARFSRLCMGVWERRCRVTGHMELLKWLCLFLHCLTTLTMLLCAMVDVNQINRGLSSRETLI